MNRTHALLIVMAGLIPIAFAQTKDTDTQQLQQLEQVWNSAHERGDADALEKLWAEDMEVAVPKMPVMTRADVLKFARSGRMKFLAYQTSDVHVRVYGDSAIVTGHLLRKREMNGQEIVDNWLFTKAYVRQSGQWRVVSFHGSDAPQS